VNIPRNRVRIPLRVLEQREKAAGDRVTRGLVALDCASPSRSPSTSVSNQGDDVVARTFLRASATSFA
jgi:hypothetical protein